VTDAAFGEPLDEHAHRRRAQSARHHQRTLRAVWHPPPVAEGPDHVHHVVADRVFKRSGAKTHHLIEDLDAAVARTVHGKRPPQYEVGVARDPQVHELPGLHGARGARGVEHDPAHTLGDTLVADHHHRLYGRCGNLGTHHSLRSKSWSARASSEPCLMTSMACTLASAAASVVMLLTPCCTAAVRIW